MKKLSKFEQIKKILECGHWVEIMEKAGVSTSHRRILARRCKSPFIYGSELVKTDQFRDEEKGEITIAGPVHDDYLDIVKVIPRPITYLSPGDKVVVLENVRELPEKIEGSQYKKRPACYATLIEEVPGDFFIGKQGIIRAANSYACLVTIDEHEYLDKPFYEIELPHHCVAPYFE